MTKMSDIQTLLRTEASRLLAENLVDTIIGFEPEDAPLRPQPVFISSVAEVDRLIINGFCQNNLARYLTRVPKDKKIAIMVRGCESRAVHALIVENQHPRDKVVLIGVPCQGIIDLKKIQKKAGFEILSAQESDELILVTTAQGTKKLNRQEFLHDSCDRCSHPNPVGVDITLGDPQPEKDPEIARISLAEFERLSSRDRYKYFVSQADRCIGCYACREACPMCYCAECFVDHTFPRWKETTNSAAGNQAWHIIRAFHQTGRCVSCGACERACPVEIKMTYLTDKLNEDVHRSYGFEVGMDEKTQPPFAAFTLDDKDRFVG